MEPDTFAIMAFTGFVASGLGALVWTRLNRIEDRLDSLVANSATRGELGAFKVDLKGDIADVRREIGGLRTDLMGEISDVRGEMGELRTGLKGEISELRTDMTSLRSDLTQIALAVGAVLKTPKR